MAACVVIVARTQNGFKYLDFITKGLDVCPPDTKHTGLFEMIVGVLTTFHT